MIEFMEAVAINEPMNATQLFVLQTFARARSERERDEITSLYLDYIQRKLDLATDQWWEENEMTNEKIGEMLNSHHRTP